MGNNWPDQETEYYETSDMPLAAYLSYMGFVMISIREEKEDSTKKIFQFSRRDGASIEETAAEYDSRRSQVEPRDFYYAIKEIKIRLTHYVKNSGGEQKRPVTSW